ncbi:hypothetical protein [Nostoc sp.]|uniref:hypothetical protein n=1 Tax=Nostoc sp. TaxID=1180 RepID=UPI002FFB6AF5
MKRRNFLNKITSYGERLQIENPGLVWQLRSFESAASGVCNRDDVCIAYPCI